MSGLVDHNVGVTKAQLTIAAGVLPGPKTYPKPRNDTHCTSKAAGFQYFGNSWLSGSTLLVLGCAILTLPLQPTQRDT